MTCQQVFGGRARTLVIFFISVCPGAMHKKTRNPLRLCTRSVCGTDDVPRVGMVLFRECESKEARSLCLSYAN